MFFLKTEIATQPDFSMWLVTRLYSLAFNITKPLQIETDRIRLDCIVYAGT